MAAHILRLGGRLALVAFVLASRAAGVDLQRETIAAFERYAGQAEARIEAQVARGGFLFATTPERRASLRANHIISESILPRRERPAPSGLIHDWAGGVFIRGVSLATVLQFVQAYDHHKEYYRPEVIGSRLLSREGDEFRIALRLLKKKVLTVVLDTEHSVRYLRRSETSWWSRSRSTRIQEIQNPGSNKEKALPADSGNGYLWRLNSYWTFNEMDGGVYVECEAISLTRDVPRGLRPIIGSIIRDLPRDSLVDALRGTRKGIARRPAN